MLIGVYVISVRYIVALCNCCFTVWIHFALVMTTVIYRYRDFGKWCSDIDVTTSQEDGTTFIDDAKKSQSLLIA